MKLPIINEPRELDYDAHMKVMDAVRITVNWLTGNLSISLFWEDIFHLLIRINQLYAMLFLAYYESWPTRYRSNMTWWFSIWIWDWNILSQENYYEVVQDAVKVRNACLGFLGAAVLLGLVSLVVQQKTLKFRLENTYSNVYWLKWLFWLVEISFVPLLFNISWYGNCTFVTNRDALKIADC